jgi:hypothetical protein
MFKKTRSNFADGLRTLQAIAANSQAIAAGFNAMTARTTELETAVRALAERIDGITASAAYLEASERTRNHQAGRVVNQ